MKQFGTPLDHADVVCVVVHGRGQSSDIMADHILSRLHVQKVSFVLPDAPTKSWYDARAIDPLSDLTSQQLKQSLLTLHTAMTEAQIVGKPVVLVGFSQGACLSMEYAFEHGSWRGALVCFTGCRVGAVSDVKPRAAMNGMRVYLSGSDVDPWIPITGFSAAAGEFAAAGARLRCDVIPGRPHEVSEEEIGVLNDLLNLQTASPSQSWSGAM
jgi:phospholipase/carboxylesterase